MTWNKKVRRQLQRSLKGYSIDFGDGYLNLARKDGVNCEFYPSDETQEQTYLTATYTVNGKITEIDVLVPDELDAFKSYVDSILSLKRSAS